jgi:putative aldouronate transport system permease protein
MLLDIGRMFYGDFGMVYALVKDSGQLLPAVDVIDTYVYRMLRVTGDPSMSMAIGFYQAFVGFVLVFSANAMVKKFFPEGTLF